MQDTTSETSSIRLAVAPGVPSRQLADLLALQREEEPETTIAIDEVPGDTLMAGLQEGRYDAGLALSDATDAALRSQPLWREPMAVAMPLRYPLLSKTTLTLDDVLRYPVFRWQAELCPLLDQQMIAHLPKKPCDIQCVTSFEMMALRVAAGYGIGITAQSRIVHARAWNICMRPLLSDSDASFEIVTYWLCPDGKADPACTRFAHRARQVAKTDMA